jgi:hypothetical protein
MYLRKRFQVLLCLVDTAEERQRVSKIEQQQPERPEIPVLSGV